MATAKPIKGYFICRVCGKREPQSTYDYDVSIVCTKCDKASGICQGCYRDPCECLPDDCNCDPE